jgi:hypothetical protein
MIKEMPLPFEVNLSFELLIKQYHDRLADENNPILRAQIQNLLEYLENFPALTKGITHKEALEAHQEPIRVLLSDLFPKALTLNEIKVATVPLKNILFNPTERFEKILAVAGENFKPTLAIEEDVMYMMSCSFILGKYYNTQLDLKRPFYYKIPDEHGINRTYKLAINADFTAIKPKKGTQKISQKVVDELLKNYDDIELWKTYFPIDSYILSGFTILNLTDVTVDTVISDLKSNLLDHVPNSKSRFDDFEANFKKLYNNIPLHIGFTLFGKETNSFSRNPNKLTDSFLLGTQEHQKCKDLLCSYSYKKLIEKHELFSIADVEDYAEKTMHNALAKTLLESGINSCIFAPIVYQKELLGILEITAPKKNELNSINATKIQDILPYIVTTVKRTRDLAENQIKAIIQNECTAIHPTVLWKFEEEAQKFIRNQQENSNTTFKDVGFDYVYPLFGQIDIKGSSTARNNAIQSDLLEQLGLVKEIFEQAKLVEPLPFYDQMTYRIVAFSEDIKQEFNTTSEESLLHFLSREINPIMPHVQLLNTALELLVTNYNKRIDFETGIIQNKRKDYETTVQTINEKMARIIDTKQEEAQEIFPHFFERFKTDGVEHNIYIGQSLVQHRKFNKVYLNNLRIWQLTTMCEMENEFYALQSSVPIALDCASLLLVFSNSLSIHYRIDEKKFDVDGSYNARYEIIKKRIDKAHIKGTKERITQKGKLVIVYSQRKDELEYLRYLGYLHKKNYVGGTIETLTLEDLQGVVGLKALRVNIIYKSKKEAITYSEFLKEIQA